MKRLIPERLARFGAVSLGYSNLLTDWTVTLEEKPVRPGDRLSGQKRWWERSILELRLWSSQGADSEGRKGQRAQLIQTAQGLVEQRAQLR